MAEISIPGGQGSTLTFSVTGNAAGNYASDFSKAVLGAGISSLSSGGSESTVPGALNLISASATTNYLLTTGGQYTYAEVSSDTNITGSPAGGDTVLGGGGLIYTADGANNRVTFTDGNNVYEGDSIGGNTITGGSGADTINAGAGSNTIFAGSGSSLISLGDTVGGDVAVLLAGTSTIEANGVNDIVYASAANASTSATIYGGSGLLSFVAGPSQSTLPISIVGGLGTTHIFANAGSDIAFQNIGGTADFIAGAGNETLNGANAAGGFAFFGDTVSGDASSINQSIVGGTGADYFGTGGGNETIVAGSGEALFHISDLGASTDITVANLQSTDFFNFGGLTVSQEESLLSNSSTVSGGNLSITLSDGTKVEFLGTTSFTGHLV